MAISSTRVHTMQAHEQRVHDRAALIRSLASKHNVKGYDHSPVEEDRATEFGRKLKDIHQRMTSGYEKLAATGAAKTDTLSKNHLKLASQQTQHKVERDNFWQNIVGSYAISRSPRVIFCSRRNSRVGSQPMSRE